MARHNPPAIEDLLYGLTVGVLLSGLEVEQRWAQSIRGWVTGAYNAAIRPLLTHCPEATMMMMMMMMKRCFRHVEGVLVAI
jgi:hypothetical protein